MPDSPAPTARPPEQSLSPWLRAGLTLACVSVLAATHLALYYTRTEFPHLEDLASHLRQFMAGTWWTKGPELWETNLKPGGPLYFWLSLPTLFMGQPVVAIHLYYFLLELAAILAWLHCGTRFKLGLGLTWIGGLLLAAYPGSKLVVCENMTIATYLSYPLFITTAAALRTRSGIRCPGERGEAPTWQDARRAHTRGYVTNEQHSQGGWIAHRSGQVISERVLSLVAHTRASQWYLGCYEKQPGWQK